MNSHWEKTALGTVLKKSDRWIILDAQTEYREVTVRLWGRGVTMRGSISGPEIAGTRRMQVRAGEFIASRIDARNGAFGLIPDELDGAVVTNDFPVFAVDTRRLLPGYLHWLSKTRDFVESCRTASEGTTNRVRLKEDRFLQIEIPLPPLAEQRRIVAKIERLAGKIEEARGIRARADASIQLLYSSAAKRCFAALAPYMRTIGDVFRVTTGGTPPRNVSAYWGGSVPWVSSGEVAFCRIRDTKEKITELGEMASNAKRYPPNTVLLAMIGQGRTRGQCAILDCSATTNQNVAAIHVYETDHMPEYVYHWLVSRYLESRSNEMGTAQPALNGRRVSEIPIPLPPLSIQRRIVAYLDKLERRISQLKVVQSKVEAELDSLLPAILDRAFKAEL